ncbi:MAG: hypothetical protein LLG05_01785 [Porphyromonadaceae bacterium]|nr:hypothetical protein [Porphyromonadaceae bacterium]
MAKPIKILGCISGALAAVEEIDRNEAVVGMATLYNPNMIFHFNNPNS